MNQLITYAKQYLKKKKPIKSLSVLLFRLNKNEMLVQRQQHSRASKM